MPFLHLYTARYCSPKAVKAVQSHTCSSYQKYTENKNYDASKISIVSLCKKECKQVIKEFFKQKNNLKYDW